jgi:DNA-binding LytR/AlgR family response regulator
MSFSSILNREYILPNSGKIRLILSAGFGSIIFFTLIIFSPFGFENISVLTEKLLVAFGYGFIAFLVWYLVLLSIKLSKFNKGKLWQIIIALIITQFFAGIFSMIYNNIIFDNPSYLDFFMRFQVIVFLTGIFPCIYLILFMETNYYLKLIAQNSELLEITSSQITLHDQNPEKSLMISPDNIICIQSQDNYIKVEWKNDEDRINSTLLRATLNSAITVLSNSDNIIQCHRSYLINLNYVDSVKGNALSKKCIMLFSRSVVPIARPKVQLILDRLGSKV